MGWRSVTADDVAGAWQENGLWEKQQEKLLPRIRYQARVLVLTFFQIMTSLCCPYLFSLRTLYD